MIHLLGAIPKGEFYVACSGGVDSMAALHFLMLGGHKPKVAHFDHLTEYGAKARVLVQEFCQANNLEMHVDCVVRKQDVDESKEEFWRNERYRFFNGLKAPVVLAHHLGDAVEWWLFSSIHGNPQLIPYQRPPNIVRPFLLTPKPVFAYWAEKHKVPYLADPSNEDTAYMRNLIRKEVLPSVLKVNPGINKVIRKKLQKEFDRGVWKLQMTCGLEKTHNIKYLENNMGQTFPNPKNFCGGNFQDWLEVKLTSACNGCCSFCVEKNGFKPKESLPPKLLAEKIIAQNKKNVILLGGEPTLYKNIKELIGLLKSANKDVAITTNGSSLMFENKLKDLVNLDKLNVSIMHYDLNINKSITGIDLNYSTLKNALTFLKSNNILIRINCNLISSFIDSKEQIFKFIEFAKELGADNLRLAELKNDGRFVDLAYIFSGQYGLNKEPFTNGCWQEAVINGMPVNFRQMCGLQTNLRPKIENPVQYAKNVLYHNGIVYDGWQQGGVMAKSKTEKKIQACLEQLANKTITIDQATELIAGIVLSVKFNAGELPNHDNISVGCHY